MNLYRYIEIEGYQLKISNPDKILFPEKNITKWDYILSCAKLAPFLLRYTKNRLLTTIRYPDGIHQSFFYQKNISKPYPEWVKTQKIGFTEYVLLNDLPTLIWLANLACLEFHTSFHYFWNNNQPTEIVIDLDPSVSDFQKVIEVALETRIVLEQMNLVSYVKTSGASGLQIYIPIESHFTFEETRQINHFIANYLVKQRPDLVTINRNVRAREKKVYFDYLQHWRGKTIIAPYSPRATPDATISTPLEWEEIEKHISPKQFTLQTVHQRLIEKGDLFSPILEGSRMDLTEILRFIKKYRP